MCYQDWLTIVEHEEINNNKLLLNDLPGEHTNSAGNIAGCPGDGDVPRRLQGQHNEGHYEVSHWQMHYKQVHSRLPVSVNKWNAHALKSYKNICTSANGTLLCFKHWNKSEKQLEVNWK